MTRLRIYDTGQPQAKRMRFEQGYSQRPRPFATAIGQKRDSSDFSHQEGEIEQRGFGLAFGM